MLQFWDNRFSTCKKLIDPYTSDLSGTKSNYVRSRYDLRKERDTSVSSSSSSEIYSRNERDSFWEDQKDPREQHRGGGKEEGPVEVLLISF